MTNNDALTRFQYAADQHKITANPEHMSGPGWEAAIDGQQEVSLVAKQVVYHYNIICLCLMVLPS